MHILIAPDSFKETISAPDAAAAIAEGIAAFDTTITCDRCPVADGGEGTLAALVAVMNGRVETANVTGPLGDSVQARYGISGDHKTAIVELAEASGLAMIPPNQRDPTRTTTYGTGELIRRALDAGVETIIVCIGGSGTCDGAAGLAQAIGVRFFDSEDHLIEEPIRGGDLHTISRFEPVEKTDLPTIRVACDVTNPLCGPNGSAAVYAPQKGATAQQVERLENGLAHLASLCDVDPDMPGAGAAGGAGYGLVVFANASLQRGIDVVLEAVGFDQRCRLADLVITGEGCLDGQSLSGKAAMGVARAADKHNVPTVAIVGTTGPGVDQCAAILQSWLSLTEHYGEERARNETANCLADAAADAVGQFLR